MNDIFKSLKIADKIIDEIYKDYQGCRNCKHQPEVFQMCEWGKRTDNIHYPYCLNWDKKEVRNDGQRIN